MTARNGLIMGFIQEFFKYFGNLIRIILLCACSAVALQPDCIF
jgi:hypothetical protein